MPGQMHVLDHRAPGPAFQQGGRLLRPPGCRTAQDRPPSDLHARVRPGRSLAVRVAVHVAVRAGVHCLQDTGRCRFHGSPPARDKPQPLPRPGVLRAFEGIIGPRGDFQFGGQGAFGRQRVLADGQRMDFCSAVRGKALELGKKGRHLSQTGPGPHPGGT